MLQHLQQELECHTLADIVDSLCCWQLFYEWQLLAHYWRNCILSKFGYNFFNTMSGNLLYHRVYCSHILHIRVWMVIYQMVTVRFMSSTVYRIGSTQRCMKNFPNKEQMFTRKKYCSSTFRKLVWASPDLDSGPALLESFLQGIAVSRVGARSLY